MAFFVLDDFERRVQAFVPNCQKFLQASDRLSQNRDRASNDLIAGAFSTADKLGYVEKAIGVAQDFLECMRKVHGQILDSRFRRDQEHTLNTSVCLPGKLIEYVKDGKLAVHNALQKYQDLEDACGKAERTLRSFQVCCKEILKELRRVKSECERRLNSASLSTKLQSFVIGLVTGAVTSGLLISGNTQMLADHAIDGSRKVVGLLGHQMDSYCSDPNHQMLSDLQECIARVQSIQRSSEAALEGLEGLEGDLRMAKQQLYDCDGRLRRLCGWLGCCGPISAYMAWGLLFYYQRDQAKTDIKALQKVLDPYAYEY